MLKFLKFSVLIMLLIFLSGCATLRELANEAPTVNATPEISAVSTLTSDVVDSPWDNLIQVGIGYALALLRQWYKKKQGAK